MHLLIVSISFLMVLQIITLNSYSSTSQQNNPFCTLNTKIYFPVDKKQKNMTICLPCTFTAWEGNGRVVMTCCYGYNLMNYPGVVENSLMGNILHWDHVNRFRLFVCPQITHLHRKYD